MVVVNGFIVLFFCSMAFSFNAFWMAGLSRISSISNCFLCYSFSVDGDIGQCVGANTIQKASEGEDKSISTSVQHRALCCGWKLCQLGAIRYGDKVKVLNRGLSIE